MKLHSQKLGEGWTPYISREEEAALRQENEDLRADRAQLIAQATGLEQRLNATEADNVKLLRAGAPEGSRIGILGELTGLRRDNAKLRQEAVRIQAEGRAREERLHLTELENAGLRRRVSISIAKADADVVKLGPNEEYNTRGKEDKQMQVLTQHYRA